MISGEEMVSRMEEKIQHTMKKFPFETRAAASKWIFLQAHGYIADRRYDGGLIICKKDRPHIRGRISWWGKVTWER